MEILHNDLDFDPSKKENNDMLRRMVLQEVGHRGMSTNWNGTPENGNGNGSFHLPSNKDDDVLEAKAIGDIPVVGEVMPPTPIQVIPEEDEEMDVVEQLYGSDLSHRPGTTALNDSIALPTARKNKDLDLEVWSKSSAPPSPAFGPHIMEHSRSISDPRNSMQVYDVQPPSLSGNPSRGHDRALSLEEYSERMRTAAVMLAQLNSNIVREPVTSIAIPGAPPPTSEQTAAAGALSALRWIPGSSWIPGVSQTGGGPGGEPVMRMRLQRSEAQAIRDRIMQEMLALEEERMGRMRAPEESGIVNLRDIARNSKTAEDESIIRRELNKVDPSAAIFRESWSTKKVWRISSWW